MTLKIADPLYLLSSQTGLSVNELRQDAGVGNMSPQSSQASVKIGEPVPIVFCRRRTVNSVDQGGAFIAPKATEGFFSNQAVNTTLQYKYRLVLSQGQLTQIKKKDVYQKSCRKGTTLNQVYNGRAGSWTPDNNITVLSSGETWATPSFVGTGGSYADMTTFSFESSVSQSDNTWKNQIFVFIRGGVQVTRLADATSGPSDNFADLAKYLLEKTERVGSSLIDTTALTVAAKFTEANGLHFNGELSQSQNLQDYLQKESYNFLLRLTHNEGKFGLRPRLPYDTSTHAIKTTAITPKFTFDEEFIVEDGFEIEYIPIEDRTPVCFQVLWKQQPDDNFALVRTTEIRYSGEAPNGPFVQIDMSGYCTTSDHSAKVGAYALAVRKYVTHHLRIKVRERNYNSEITVGDIVRVRLQRENSFSVGVSHHDFMYEVERIQKTMQGFLAYDLTHFPIDSQGRSKVAREVDNATGPTSQLSIGQGTFDCDVNTPSDPDFNSDIGNTSTSLPSLGDFDFTVPQPSNSSSINFDADLPGGGENWDSPVLDPPPPFNPEIDQLPDSDPLKEDSLDQPEPTPQIGGYSGTPGTGDTLTLNPGCANPLIKWYKININTGVATKIGEGVSATLEVTEALQTEGVRVYGEGCCPDPSQPGGYRVCKKSDEVDIFDEIIDCPGGGDAGNQGTFTKVINVGTAFPASFNFRYTAYTIQDRFVISGAASLDTGFVSGVNVNVTVQKTSADPYITVTVFAPTSGTAWNYDVGCAS